MRWVHLRLVLSFLTLQSGEAEGADCDLADCGDPWWASRCRRLCAERADAASCSDLTLARTVGGTYYIASPYIAALHLQAGHAFGESEVFPTLAFIPKVYPNVVSAKPYDMSAKFIPRRLCSARHRCVPHACALT